MAIREEWYRVEFQQREQAQSHRALQDEYAFYEAVKEGNLDYVRKNCKDNEFTKTTVNNVLSERNIQNLRYHFIITTALICRFCVEGGMELEQAYSLSDFYIAKMDKLNIKDDIINLHHTMVLDYTDKMHALMKVNAVSRSVSMCLDFIYMHRHSKITLQNLADYVNLVPSYLSRLFQKEMHISISEYIRKQKMEAAENMLRYSEYTVADIANYLAFSSQSYFIQVFHNYTGFTPNAYRKTYYKSIWR